MVLRKRWYVARTARASKIANVGRRGFVPAILEYLPELQLRGRYWGMADVPMLGFGVVALGYDGSVPLSKVTADFAALDSAPDNRVFHLGASFKSQAIQWSRRPGFIARMNALNLDGERIVSDGKTVLQVFREMARNVVLYQRLSRWLPSLPIDQTLGDLLPLQRAALQDHVMENLGVRQSQLGSGTTTLRAWYRVLLSGFAPELEQGKWHLGHRQMNLK